MVANTNKILYEGKAKILYNGLEPKTLIQYFKDDATANNAEKHAVIKSKGILNKSHIQFRVASDRSSYACFVLVA